MAGPHGAMDSTAYLPPSTAAIREMRNSTVASNSSSPLPIPAYRRESTQSMLLSPSSPAPPPSRSGGRITPPIRAEMSITEQIARQTRKSTVLDPKNALLIMAIPDYDDYKIMQPYSCRSLSNRSKFMGNRDFITRHNPQEVNEFKKQYSREVGNLNRHRSIVAPPTPDVSVAGLLSSSTWSAGLLSPPPKSSSSSNNNLSTLDNVLWRKTLTSSMKACWVLTDVGIQTLIGPEYRLTTRTQVLPALPSPRPQRPPLSCRSPGTPTGRPETPSMFTARDSARKGVGVDLADEKTLATLSRLAVSSPKPRASTCSPSKKPFVFTAMKPTTSDSESDSTTIDGIRVDGEELISMSPYAGVSWEKNNTCGGEAQQILSRDACVRTASQHSKTSGFRLHSARGAAPERQLPVVMTMVQQFAMEISPPSLALGTLHTGQVYLFPVRVRNVGSLQERFRVKYVSATCAGFGASIAEASYQRESARLAPGLAAIVTVALSFQHPGRITGSLRVEAEGLGECDVDIKGTVRVLGK